MVVQIREFTSVEEIGGALDRQISETKSRLGECLRRLDDVRTLAEKTKRIRQVIMKLAGKRAMEESLGEISIDGFSVVLDAGPLDELTVIESSVRSYQQLLLNLQKAREALKPLDELGETEGMTYLVVENDGIPERILLKIA
jgi:hypothetical protein